MQEEVKKEEKFSLYALLQVDPKASKEDIVNLLLTQKKQFKVLALQCHPDKNKEDPQARQKFQKLKEACDILMDDEKRQQYDETGTVGE